MVATRTSSVLAVRTRQRRASHVRSMKPLTHEPSDPHRTPLLEREPYLTDLARWLESGTGGIVLVSGEAGIGKTSLLQEFCRRQSSARVLWGACDALFTPRPLAPLHDIARQTKGALLGALDGGESRDRVFSAALDELESGPASLVVFEDVHWADEATLDLLKFLGRRIQRTRATLALTYRDDEVGARHPLRFVLGEFPRPVVHRAPLSPLSQRAVEQLAHEAGRPLKDLYGITGGNPLFVTEALAAEGDRVPVTVRDAVLARAVRLSPAARQIAELVSVIPGKAEAWLLKEAGCLDEAAIESCLSMGMVHGEDGSLAFRHELARRAYEDSLSQARERELHAQVLTILAQRPGSPPARLAHHAAGARSTLDVLNFAPLAGKYAASVGAHREAAAHYRVALRYADGLTSTERALLHERYSYECYLTDQGEEAIEARRASLAIWQSLDERRNEGDTLRWLSRLSWFVGRRAEAERYGAEAVAVLESLPPGPELAMAYSNLSQLEMLAHEVPAAIRWARRTIELAEPIGDQQILSHALNNLGTARLISGDAAGEQDLERSLQLALEGNFTEHAARAYTNLASTMVVARDYPRAERYLRDGIGFCDGRDLDAWRLYMLSWRARLRFQKLDWNGASEDAEAVLRDPRTAPISRVTALTILGHIRIRRADPDPDSLLNEARAIAAGMEETQRVGPIADALAEAAWLVDDRECVIREVGPAYELGRDHQDPWSKGILAAWLWRAGALSEIPTDIALPYALEIARDWRGAALAWDELGCPYEKACMLAWYGGEAEQREALMIFEQSGAAAAGQVLRKKMRAQGVQSIPRGSRATTRQDPHGLTRREAEILDLLSEGLRNSAIAKRLFLSTKTVDHHVSAILNKLGVPSRAEAVAMARKLSRS
jgi:DNA-binding CsgD family transcriptional regulator/tetratricopeptide (TPR) repeat protein